MPKVSPTSPPPPPTPTTNGIPDDKVATAPLLPLLPPTTSTVLNTSHLPQLPASEESSSSAPNPTPHTSLTSSELLDDEDTRFKLRDIELTNREQALEEEIKLAKKLRNDSEIERRTKEIVLRQWGERMDSLEDEIVTREQDLREAELRNREKRLKYRDGTLNNPLLQQDDQNRQNKDDDVWDKRQNIMAISLACGLSVLISMQPLFPPDFLKWIVGAFAIVWVLATIAFPAGLFGTYRVEKDFSRHISRLTFMSFAVFVLYILYILSQPPAPHSSGLTPSPPQPPAPHSSGLTSSPPQQLLELWVPSVDFNAMFYIVLGLLTLIGHIALWILIQWEPGDSFEQVFFQARKNFRQPFFTEVVILAAWHIWKQRNDAIFRNVLPSFRSWKRNFIHEITMHVHRVKSKDVQSLSSWIDNLH